jgi:hypothetical protein
MTAAQIHLAQTGRDAQAATTPATEHAGATAPAVTRVRRTTSLRRMLRTAALAALTAGGVALAGASAAHAASDTATLDITGGKYPQAIVTGQFGAATLAEAKALMGATSIRIELWGDDVSTDDYLGVLTPVHRTTPTTSALPFSAQDSACYHDWLNEDDSLFNRTDEVYARVYLLGFTNQVMRSIKTNVVSTEFGHVNIGFSPSVC